MAQERKTIKEWELENGIKVKDTKYVCFKSMKLAIDYEALEKEKQALEDTVEMQSSMIADLEANCKDLYIEIENLKFGGNE